MANICWCSKFPMAVDVFAFRSGTSVHCFSLGLEELLASPLTCSHSSILGSWRPSFLEHNCLRQLHLADYFPFSLSPAHTPFHQACSGIQSPSVWNCAGSQLLKHTWRVWFWWWKRAWVHRELEETLEEKAYREKNLESANQDKLKVMSLYLLFLSTSKAERIEI